MVVDEKVLEFFTKVVGVGGIVAYIIHSFYTRYCKFQDNIYAEISKRQTISQCDKNRKAEADKMEDLDEDIKRTDADLQRHKEMEK